MGPLPQKQPIEPDRPDDAGAQEPPDRDRNGVDRQHRDFDDAGLPEPGDAADKMGGTAHRRAR
jgi:hypothetical protein